jgi:hypothetical protein
MSRKRQLLGTAIACLGLVLSTNVEAGLRRTSRIQTPVPVPAPPPTTAAVANNCCPPVCVTYRDRACRRVCCDPCLPDIQTTMVVCDPCTGCPVPVDVCLPGCCTDCPTVSERCTLFGRGAITYCWACGFSATFRFTRHGDVIVTYRS